MPFRLGLSLVLGAWFAVAMPQARAQAPVELVISGQVEHPRTLTMTELQVLPATTIDVTHVEHGGQTNSYTGTLLWPLLDQAAPISQSPRTRLQHTLIAHGQDGYGVALALAELAPEFEGKPVLLAYAEDGKPLPGLRLVVPGDKRAGRSVRDVVGIEVR